jgi:hypothetical protein
MQNSVPHSIRIHTLTVLACALAVTVCLPSDAAARGRERDRFGLRLGIWPQPEISGSFGQRAIYDDNPTPYNVRIDEESRILPFIELFGLFHLGDRWWLEGSIGWTGRNDVNVDAVAGADEFLVGAGRVDFFPMFAGIRAIEQLGGRDKPHNIYARAGGSLMFASESAELIDPDLRYGLYAPGTEGAFGFLVGAGGEFYTTPGFALTADVAYRYSKFSYARRAEFDLSTIWMAAGAVLRLR